MARALQLARRAKGACNPNPAVGAILVRDGVVLGEGFTQPRGQAHAEVVALSAAGAAAPGATLYVTLEPCAHQGLTGPCVDRIVEVGVATVHCSMLDPSPWVNGRGQAALEERGIRVQLGDGEPEARSINRDYFHWVRVGRPLVTAKYAMSLDGKTATRTGSSQWVSGDTARALVGQMRAQADAVLVGIGTVLADDPRLTARFADDRPFERQPLRVVVDSRGRLPATSRVLDESLPSRTLVVTTRAGLDRLAGLSGNVEVWPCEADADGRVRLDCLLEELGRRRLLSVLVESGGTLLAALLRLKMVDEVAAFVAPKIVGGRDAPTPVEGDGVEQMAEALELVDVTYEMVGRDLLVRGRTRYSGSV